MNKIIKITLPPSQAEHIILKTDEVANSVKVLVQARLIPIGLAVEILDNLKIDGYVIKEEDKSYGK